MSTNYPTPRNANEERIRAARASFASVDTLWSSQASVKKSDMLAAPAPTSHLSGIGGSTLRGTAPTTSRKSDGLNALPASIRDRTKGFDNGQRALLAYVYETNRRTGKPVPLDAGEAAHIMGSTVDKAARFISTLETLKLIARSYSSLGPLLGFVPAIGA